MENIERMDSVFVSLTSAHVVASARHKLATSSFKKQKMKLKAFDTLTFYPYLKTTGNMQQIAKEFSKNLTGY